MAWGRIRGPFGTVRDDEYVRQLCIYAGRPWMTPPEEPRFTWEHARDAVKKAEADKAAGKRRPGPIVPVPVPPQPEMRRAAQQA